MKYNEEVRIVYFLLSSLLPTSAVTMNIVQMLLTAVTVAIMKIAVNIVDFPSHDVVTSRTDKYGIL